MPFGRAPISANVMGGEPKAFPVLHLGMLRYVLPNPSGLVGQLRPATTK